MYEIIFEVPSYCINTLDIPDEWDYVIFGEKCIVFREVEND